MFVLFLFINKIIINIKWLQWVLELNTTSEEQKLRYYCCEYAWPCFLCFRLCNGSLSTWGKNVEHQRLNLNWTCTPKRARTPRGTRVFSPAGPRCRPTLHCCVSVVHHVGRPRGCARQPPSHHQPGPPWSHQSKQTRQVVDWSGVSAGFLVGGWFRPLQKKKTHKCRRTKSVILAAWMEKQSHFREISSTCEIMRKK